MTGRARWRRLLRRHRRWVVAALAGSSVAAALVALSPDPPPTTRVLAVTSALPAGTVLSGGDVELRDVPVDLSLSTAITRAQDAVGRTLATAVDAGEVLRPARLVGPGLLSGQPDLVALPLRINDGGAVAVLRPGDQVDVLTAAADGRTSAVTLADRVRVLAVPTESEAVAEGGLAVLGVTEEQARRLVAAAGSAWLSVTVHPVADAAGPLP